MDPAAAPYRIDALCARVPAERRAYLAREVATRFDAEQATILVLQQGRWLQTEGEEAAWVLAAWARDVLRAPGLYAVHHEVVSAFDVLLQAFGQAPWLPWIWTELVVAAPGHQRVVAQQLCGITFGPAGWNAVRTALAGPPFPHRRILATELAREGGLDGELALCWLADRSLRPLGEDYLRPRVSDVEAALRMLLADGDASSEAREAALRLLRRIDPTLSAEGKTARGDDAELQARLRDAPDDGDTLRVWADLLESRGDPRGPHIAMELAITEAPPPRALELSRALAEHCREHRGAIWARPGGVPYRETYGGRQRIAFGSDGTHRVRDTTVGALFDRMQRFATEVTDQAGPHAVFIGKVIGLRPPTSLTTRIPTPLERDLLSVLGDARAMGYPGGALVERRDATRPLAYERGLRELCATSPGLTLRYQFKLTWPGSKIRLPHQEGSHYADGEPLAGHLAVHLADGAFDLSLQFPFERFDDPGFLAIYDAITRTLGRVMTPSRFAQLTPSADGRRLVARSARFDRLP